MKDVKNAKYVVIVSQGGTLEYCKNGPMAAQVAESFARSSPGCVVHVCKIENIFTTEVRLNVTEVDHE